MLITIHVILKQFTIVTYVTYKINKRRIVYTREIT